jgi:hypothetical protein
VLKDTTTLLVVVGALCSKMELLAQALQKMVNKDMLDLEVAALVSL